MSITYSDELARLILAKIEEGLLKHARKLSFWHDMIHTTHYNWTGDKDYATQLLVKVHESYGLPVNFTTAAVQKSARRWWVFVFDCSEQEAIDKIHNECKRGKVPHKVKVRMVIDRLDKAQACIADSGSAYTYPPMTRKILTKDGFLEYLTGLERTNTYFGRNRIPWFLAGINEVLIK